MEQGLVWGDAYEYSVCMFDVLSSHLFWTLSVYAF